MKKRFLGMLVTILLVMTGIGASAVNSPGPVTAPTKIEDEAVILVHGLGRTQRSMHWIRRDLQRTGYAVVNVDYPSLKWTIEMAADRAVAQAVDACRSQAYRRIHFVTHSMGAIVVRHYLQDNQLPEGSRVVMLAPPNSGSEVMDWARTRIGYFDFLAGPAAADLETSSTALHARLRPVAPAVGVIAGRRSWNPIFSAIIPGEDDGKVAVQRARLAEMRDFIVVEANHTTMLLNASVRRQVVGFLQSGRFSHDEVF